jgi:uncharacterized protein YggE
MLKKPLIRATILVMALGLSQAAAARSAAADPAPRQITVIGEGHVDVTPDMATVSIGVSQEADRAADAMLAMGQGMTAVMESLTAAGIAAEDIRTGSLQLDPRYDSGGFDGIPRVSGYTASTALDVQVRDLDGLGALLDAAVQEAANRMNGLSFGLQDDAPALRAARQAAVADARAKAELYAAAAGVGLGPVVTISEMAGAGQPVPFMQADMAVARMSVPIAPGQLTIDAQVVIVFEIAD